MMWPPWMLRVSIRNRDRRIGLWLPLFLAWPLMLILTMALLPVVLLLLLLLWPVGRGRSLLRAGPVLFELLCALRGLLIDVESPTRRVYIGFR